MQPQERQFETPSALSLPSTWMASIALRLSNLTSVVAMFETSISRTTTPRLRKPTGPQSMIGSDEVMAEANSVKGSGSDRI
eukprot:3138149-Amphidinium_carterae.1